MPMKLRVWDYPSYRKSLIPPRCGFGTRAPVGSWKGEDVGAAGWARTGQVLRTG